MWTEFCHIRVEFLICCEEQCFAYIYKVVLVNKTKFNAHFPTFFCCRLSEMVYLRTRLMSHNSVELRGLNSFSLLFVCGVVGKERFYLIICFDHKQMIKTTFFCNVQTHKMNELNCTAKYKLLCVIYTQIDEPNWMVCGILRMGWPFLITLQLNSFIQHLFNRK